MNLTARIQEEYADAQVGTDLHATWHIPRRARFCCGVAKACRARRARQAILELQVRLYLHVSDIAIFPSAPVLAL